MSFIGEGIRVVSGPSCPKSLALTAVKVLISANWLVDSALFIIDADVSSIEFVIKLLNTVGWPSPREPLKVNRKKTRNNVPQNPKRSVFNKRIIFFRGLYKFFSGVPIGLVS